jgi:hypothetical protein
MNSMVARLFSESLTDDEHFAVKNMGDSLEDPNPDTAVRTLRNVRILTAAEWALRIVPRRYWKMKQLHSAAHDHEAFQSSCFEGEDVSSENLWQIRKSAYSSHCCKSNRRAGRTCRICGENGHASIGCEALSGSLAHFK